MNQYYKELADDTCLVQQPVYVKQRLISSVGLWVSESQNLADIAAIYSHMRYTQQEKQ